MRGKRILYELCDFTGRDTQIFLSQQILKTRYVINTLQVIYSMYGKRDGGFARGILQSSQQHCKLSSRPPSGSNSSSHKATRWELRTEGTVPRRQTPLQSCGLRLLSCRQHLACHSYSTRVHAWMNEWMNEWMRPAAEALPPGSHNQTAFFISFAVNVILQPNSGPWKHYIQAWLMKTSPVGPSFPFPLCRLRGGDSHKLKERGAPTRAGIAEWLRGAEPLPPPTHWIVTQWEIKGYCVSRRIWVLPDQ